MRIRHIQTKSGDIRDSQLQGGSIMRIRQVSLIVASVVVALLALASVFSVFTVWAGDPDSPGGPTSDAAKMYTLEDIYNRINDGTTAISTTFTEPSSGPPTGTMHTLDEIMELLKSTYTRVPKTGQTTSYATGDDGEYELGVSPKQEPTYGSTTGAYTVYGWAGTRFTDNGDGTVSDNLTGLIWLENANCFGWRTWAQALSDANGLASGSCGLTDGSSAGDWRLPNVNELHSLVDLSQSGSPKLPAGHPFSGVESSSYWSGTTYAPVTTGAWYVYLDSGYVYNGSKDDGHCVWPVRGGQ
jgi:hypothetical protein